MGRLRTPLLLGVLAVLCAAVPAGASNSTTYPDSTGEGGGDPAVPDISSSVVSNDDTGLITIRVNVPNRPTLTRDMAAIVFVDSDRNPATGDPSSLGADYVIQLLAGDIAMFKWDGTDFTRRVGDPPQTSLVYQYANGAVTIQISAAELGNTKGFGFAVIVLSGLVIDDTTGEIDDSNAKSDQAPGAGAGFYQYEVKIAPPRLVAAKPTTTPAAPRAGKSYTVRMSATRSDTGATIVNGQVVCSAKIAGKSVRGAGRFVGKQAVCTFGIPKSAKGKMIRGTITIVFEGLRATGAFGGKIR